MRRLLLLLTITAGPSLWAGQGAVLPAGKSGTIAIPAIGTAAYRIEVEIHNRTWSPSGASTPVVQMYAANHGYYNTQEGSAFSACRQGNNAVYASSTTNGAPPAHFWVRYERHPLTNQVTCEMFDKSTGAVRTLPTVKTATYASTTNHSSSGSITIGGANADFTIDTLRIWTGDANLLPLGSPSPDAYIGTAANFLDIRFEGNATDQSGNGYTVTWSGGTDPSYETTPSYPPICDAGPDVVGRAGGSVSLDAAASQGRNSEPLSYLWQVMGVTRWGVAVPLGGLNVGWTGQTTATPTLNVPRTADYLVQLTVADSLYSAACNLHVGAVAYDSNGVVVPDTSTAERTTMAEIIGPVIAHGRNPWHAADAIAWNQAKYFNSLYGAGSRIDYWAEDQLDAGTISVTNGSPTVTGTGTDFQTLFCGGGSSWTSGHYIHINYPVPGETDTYGWKYYAINSCDSATQVTLSANFTNGGTGGSTFSGLRYVNDRNRWSMWLGGTSPSFVNFYDAGGLANYTMYQRTGLEQFRTGAHFVVDIHYKASWINSGWSYATGKGGGAVKNPRDTSMPGMVLRALDGRSDMWTGLRRIASYFAVSGNYITGTIGEREAGAALWAASLMAEYDPDSSSRTALQAGVSSAIDNHWVTRQCQPATGGRDCNGYNHGQIAVGYFTNTAGGVLTASVTNGSPDVTITSGSVTEAMATDNYFYVAYDDEPAYFRPTRLSSTSLTLMADDGVTPRPYEGSTNVAAQAVVGRNVGFAGVQPFMVAGYIGSGLWWANKATGNTNATRILLDQLNWLRDYGTDYPLRGFFYAAEMESCRPHPSTPVRRMGCAYVADTDGTRTARALAAESPGTFSRAYLDLLQTDPTAAAALKSYMDDLYGAAYGMSGFACDGDIASTCDGDYAQPLTDSYTEGSSLLGQDKYYGWASGIGGGMMWPAARLGPRTPQSRAVKIYFSVSDHPLASDGQVEIKDPNGATVDTQVCASSPCTVTVDDDDIGYHLYRINLRDGSGNVVLPGRWEPMPVR